MQALRFAGPPSQTILYIGAQHNSIVSSICDGYDVLVAESDVNYLIDLKDVLEETISSAFDDRLKEVSLPLDAVQIHSADMDRPPDAKTRVFIHPLLMSPFIPSDAAFAKLWYHCASLKVRNAK